VSLSPVVVRVQKCGEQRRNGYEAGRFPVHGEVGGQSLATLPKLSAGQGGDFTG
jgi:hypothetical protein